MSTHCYKYPKCGCPRDIGLKCHTYDDVSYLNKISNEYARKQNAGSLGSAIIQQSFIAGWERGIQDCIESINESFQSPIQKNDVIEHLKKLLE